MKNLKALLPYFILSLVIIVFWKSTTRIDSYVWNPVGKEILLLELALTSIFVYKCLFWLLIGNLALFGILNLIKRHHKFGLIVLVIAVFLYSTIGKVVAEKTAGDYYIVFVNQSVSEEYIDQPIKDAGKSIGKIITNNIIDRNMKHRRYAISSLATINYKDAIETLEKIANDATEPDYIRNDAAETIIKLK